MMLRTWNPLDEFKSIANEMHRFLKSYDSELATADENLDEQVWTPRVNISENDNEYVLELDVPGIKKEDIKISLKENRLMIEGERKYKKEKEDRNWVRREAFYGKFQRSFLLPNDVDSGKTDAKFKDGVLTITLAKREESKPREISISVN